MQSMNHIPVNELPYNKPVKTWLRDRYGKEADWILDKTVQNYNGYLPDLPNYGGKKTARFSDNTSAQNPPPESSV